MATSKNQIYKITVLNWLEHNSGTKKHFKKTLIANNLISDAKINALPLSCKWLFINLLLICGDYAKDTITLTERQVNDILTSKEGPQNALDRLASFQLVSYEKNDFLRIEKKERKEDKGKEKKFHTPKKSEPSPLNSQIWEAYKDAYFQRYKVEPTRNASVNAKISQLGKRVGDDAIELVKFYLKHNDGFYLKSLHSIGLCLSHAESLNTQMKRNRPVTSVDVRNFEKQQNMHALAKAIDEGENF